MYSLQHNSDSRQKGHKGVLWVNWGRLGSQLEQNLFGSSRFSIAVGSPPDPPSSASDLDSVGAFLWLDGETSKGPPVSTKGGHEYSMPNRPRESLGSSLLLDLRCALLPPPYHGKHTRSRMQVRPRRPRTLHRSLVLITEILEGGNHNLFFFVFPDPGTYTPNKC